MSHSPTAFAVTSLALTAFSGLALAAAGDTELISVRLPGQTTASNFSQEARVSANGHFVAFSSAAADLVPNDRNKSTDVFLRNLLTGDLERISVSSAGAESNGESTQPSVSGDGRYIAFISAATNLVAGDTNNAVDVFVRDRQTGQTQRVSLSSSGQQVSDGGFLPKISANGRFVVFASSATNLVSGDTNGVTDLFLRDLTTGQTERVSLGAGGVQANSDSIESAISADGRFVAFTSFATNLVTGDTNGRGDIFVRDRQTAITERVAVSSSEVQADGSSSLPSISDDGRLVAFVSSATNLVAGDTNTVNDIFIRDRQTGLTERDSVSSAGVQANGSSEGPAISGDGRYVVFPSASSTLAPNTQSQQRYIYLRDRQLSQTQVVSLSTGGELPNNQSLDPTISADGLFVAFQSYATNLAAGDRNDWPDVFVRDRQGNTLGLVSAVEIASRAAGGVESGVRQALSADGRYAVFTAGLSNVVPNDTNNSADVVVRDRQTEEVELISANLNGDPANIGGHSPALSADGRFVAFESTSGGLVSGMPNNGWNQIYVRDRQTGQTEIVTLTPNGQPGNGDDSSKRASISADGRYVAFDSDLLFVPGDTNVVGDVFVRDRQTGLTDRVSVSSSEAQGNANSGSGSISADGRYVAFGSGASNLVSGDSNNREDIFVRDRQLGTTERVSVTSGGVQGDGHSFRPFISANGRFVAFYSSATNLVAGDTNGLNDIFVHDRQTGATERVSVSSGGVQANDFSVEPVLSDDGRFVAFESFATNLVAGDTNGVRDIFVRDRQEGTTARASVDFSGVQADDLSDSASLSGDGRLVEFISLAGNLIDADPNGLADAYVHDQATETARAGYTVAPLALNFGAQTLNTSRTLNFTLRNTGTVALPLTDIELRGTNKGQFHLVSHCGASIAVGASCKISVTFRPTSVGAKSAKLHTEAGNIVRTRDLTGTGRQP